MPGASGTGIGGKGVVIVAGDVGAVNAAVKAATDANESLNLRITEHYVIPNPDPSCSNLSEQAHYCLSERVMCVPAGEISRERKTEGKMGV